MDKIHLELAADHRWCWSILHGPGGSYVIEVTVEFDEGATSERHLREFAICPTREAACARANELLAASPDGVRMHLGNQRFHPPAVGQPSLADALFADC